MRIICGMHRSGTSLIARISRRLGADLGEERTFHPPDKWNPDGYFEQRQVLAVNRDLVNGPWGRASYLKLPSDRTIARRARRVASKIETLSERYRRCVVKENRFCLTLGAWREHGGMPERLLIVFRNPQDVARSLLRRNRIPGWLAMRLWMVHHSRLMRHAEGIPFATLWYDALVSGERGAARQYRKLAWFLGAKTENVVSVAQAMIKPSIKRQSFSLPDDVARLYGKLQEMNEGTP